MSSVILNGSGATPNPPADGERGPSHTALTAAAARAAHLIVDSEPFIFADTQAEALLGEQAAEFLGFHRSHGGHPVLASARVQVTTRSRFTEDRLARSGLGQYVILGAGLDSYAYRCPASGVRVFEVDHPATQQWKRAALAAAGIPLPDAVAFVPADFERGGAAGGGSAGGPLAASLRRAGFDLARPALVSWLGVVMYLTREAIGQTLAAVGSLAPGTELICDYMLPAGLRDEAGEAYASQVMPVAAERGEPWRSFLAPGEMTALLATHGLERAEHISQRDAIGPAGWDRSDPLRPIELSRLAHATVTRA